MRYQPDHKARTHRRIVENAARRFRADGLNGAGVAALMKASGLTVGGFYKHFRSKDDLLLEAVEQGLRDSRESLLNGIERIPARQRWKEIMRRYLSLEHCQRADTGCPVAALAPETARTAPAVKKRIAALMKDHLRRFVPFAPGRSPEEKQRNCLAGFAAAIGAINMARNMTKTAEKEQILRIVRGQLLAGL
ncbi:MAG TPA: TetR/AcrR family transcriptional regulator [Candidatus Angelobacter sp.]|nr:TetR/AcrR family transcriptional regulator [Candidatus Angelobacter sp.]